MSPLQIAIQFLMVNAVFESVKIYYDDRKNSKQLIPMYKSMYAWKPLNKKRLDLVNKIINK